LNWFTVAHLVQEVEVFQLFGLHPLDEAPAKTASNWYGPGFEGAVKVPANFPLVVVTIDVVTVFRGSHLFDPICLYIKVTVLPVGTCGSECLIDVTWPEKETEALAGNPEDILSVVCVSIQLILAPTLGIAATNKTKTVTTATAKLVLFVLFFRRTIFSVSEVFDH